MRSASQSNNPIGVSRPTGFDKSAWIAPGFIARTLLSMAILVYAGGHLSTLARSPSPWFDDTFFASVTLSLLQNGELRLPVSPLWFDQPVYIYGPVYFAITSTFVKLFGFGLFQFRLAALLFGFGILGLTYALLRQGQVSRAISGFFCALLALDPTFYKHIHNGRMDSTAIFFLLLGLYLLLREARPASKTDFLWLFLAGLSASLGVLATPRPAYLVAALGLIAAYRSYFVWPDLRIQRLLYWGLGLTIPCVVWFLYAFGTIPALIAYYASVPGGTYLGGFHIRTEHIPLFVFIAVLAALAGRMDKSAICNARMLFCFAGIAGFYIIVYDAGPYAFLMIPMVYLALGSLAFPLLSTRWKYVPIGIMAVLLCFNTAAYIARNTLVAMQWEVRDPNLAKTRLKTVIPEGSRVVGDDKYFFLIKEMGSDYQYTQRGGTLAERVAFHNSTFPADFLITERSDNSEMVQAYVKALGLTKIMSLKREAGPMKMDWIAKISDKLGFTADNGYEAAVWGRDTNARGATASP